MSEPSAATPPVDEDPRPESGHEAVDDAAETGPIGDSPQRMPADCIGKYEVVSVLGRGGMGVVFQAFDPILERDVAIKVMLPQIAADPEQKQRFEREARAIARLTHANVVTVFDLGYHTDGAPYIVMELLQGEDLLQLMHREPPLSFSQKISIVIQVLDGLGKAHKLGVVHRDVKPANVSIGEDGTAKIMDFGIAHLASVSATVEGEIMGTAAYMSPEQARGERVDGRSDLFSVGSLLCELVTGRRPFEAETIMATLYAIDHNAPAIELPEGPEYERLRPVFDKALAKKREERYQTSAEFARDLAGCLDDSAVLAARTARPAPATDPDVAAGPRPDATRAMGDPSAAHRAALLFARPPTAQAANPSKLFRLLREVYVGEKSGHLHFTAGRSCRSLRIVRGRILHGKSDVEGEHLGDVLVRFGMVAESDRARAVELVLNERRRLGDVLESEGILDRERLEEALGLHVREILFAMLEGPEGSHSFEETAEPPPGNDPVCRLSTGEVILEATRYVQDPELVRKVLGDTGRRLVLSPNPMLRSQKITLTPTDGFVMSRVDGTLSARDVVSLSPMSAEDTERSLFGLLCTGIIGYEDTTHRHRTRPRAAAHPARAATGRTRPVAVKTTTPPAAAATPTPPSPEAAPAPAAGRTESADDGGRPAEGPETLRRLIVETHARLKQDHFEVLGLERSATQDDVRQAYAQFARALHPDARRPPELAELEGKAREVFLRATTAYETLKDPEERRKYEIAFEPSKLRRPAPPPPAEARTDAKGTEAPLPPPPPPEAADTPAAFNPESTLREAEAQFAKKDYWDAIQRVEPLLPQVQGPLRTRAVLLLARAYMKNPHWQKRAEEALLGLLEDDPRCTPAYLFLGQIYAGQNLHSRARRMYRKVVELEPEHQVALAALEELEPPPDEEPVPEPEGGGLRSWFRGR